MKDDTSKLTQLGSKDTNYRYEKPCAEMLETFPNQFPINEYRVTLKSEEFTSLCPKTRQPDFAKIEIIYTPDKLCVETKSLKLYLFAYRNERTFMETITNRILNDFVAACNPCTAVVNGYFKIRGGIELRVEAHYVS